MAVVMMDVDYLVPHPQNPRKELGDLTELAQSIKENGVYQNLTIMPINEDAADEDPRFMVLIGHRRLAAAKLAGLKEVPCSIVRDLSERKQLQVMLIENMQRNDLSIVEQAQSFQQLLDFGMDIQELSRQSGFSKTTIRRRLEIAKLDQQKLKEITTKRQLSLGDFDKLAQIKDPSIRNKVLETMGTNNFQWAVNNAIREEIVNKSRPEFLKEMKRLNVKPLKEKERYTNEYRTDLSKVDLEKWESTKKYIPENTEGLYYYERCDGHIEFYYKKKRSKPSEKKSAAAIAKEKSIAEAWFKVKAMAAAHYELRKGFVEKLSCKGNLTKIFAGAFIAGIVNAVDYMSIGRDELSKMCGVDTARWDEGRVAKAFKFLDQCNEEQQKQAVYLFFGDSEKESFAGGSPKEYPKHKQSSKLQALYRWLALFDYPLSDEEKQMMNGTHEVFSQDMFKE